MYSSWKMTTTTMYYSGHRHEFMERKARYRPHLRLRVLARGCSCLGPRLGQLPPLGGTRPNAVGRLDRPLRRRRRGGGLRAHPLPLPALQPRHHLFYHFNIVSMKLSMKRTWTSTKVQIYEMCISQGFILESWITFHPNERGVIELKWTFMS